MKKLSILLSATLILSGCMAEAPQDEPLQSNEDTLKVVTSIAPLYSLSANLIEGVDNVELINLVPPNASVHSYTLTPETAKAISEADLIVINGLELETFLEDVLSESDALIVDTSEGVKLRKFEEEGHEDEHEDEHGHAHGEYDPHIWLSPVNAKMQAANIQEALIVADAENSAKYLANFLKLEEDLDNLNSELNEEISKLSIGPYVVFHDAYHYFEENSGVRAAAYIEEFPGKEPSAEYLSEVIDLIESNDVNVIFTEPQFSPKLVQTLSEDYGLRLGTLDPLGQSVAADGYFELMRANVESFKSAFGE